MTRIWVNFQFVFIAFYCSTFRKNERFAKIFIKRNRIRSMKEQFWRIFCIVGEQWKTRLESLESLKNSSVFASLLCDTTDKNLVYISYCRWLASMAMAVQMPAMLCGWAMGLRRSQTRCRMSSEWAPIRRAITYLNGNRNHPSLCWAQLSEKSILFTKLSVIENHWNLFNIVCHLSRSLSAENGLWRGSRCGAHSGLCFDAQPIDEKPNTNHKSHQRNLFPINGFRLNHLN